MRINWTQQKINYLLELKEIDKKTWREIQIAMSDYFKENFTFDSCRNKYRSLQEVDKATNSNEQTEKSYKEEIKILQDGSHTSDKLIALSEEDMKDNNAILRAHGYDPVEWELTSSQSSMWHHHNKQDGTKTLYASKIKAKPKTNGVDWEKLIQAIKNIEPIDIKIPKYKVKRKQLLEVSLFDQHFGINTYDDYKETQSIIVELITSRVWEQVVVTIGSDMLHHDNFTNKTVSGTEIEHVDMVQAWEHARVFYDPIIQRALLNSNDVKIIYIPGNHDQSLSWSFAKMLEVMYPQAKFDVELQERKVHTFENIFIGYAHGDKRPKQIPSLFPAEFPKEWAGAKTRELHLGHLHHQIDSTKDQFGMTTRTLATGGKTDKWHKDMGFVGAHKRFMVFEYSEDKLEAIHYV
jgi:hypothetical protein